MGPFGEGIAQYRVSIRFDPVKFQSADFERMVDSYHQITQEVRMSDDDDANRGMYPERSRVPLDVDDVYSKYGGTAVKFTGEEYLVLSARDPLAVSRENRENFGVGIENVAAAAALSDGEFNAEHELGLVFDADPRSAHYRSLFPRSAFPATVVDVLGSGGNVREVIATSGFDALLKVLRTGSLNRGHDVELVPGSLISIPTPDPPPELLTAITHLVEHFADDEASTDQKITDALEATHVLPASAHLHARVRMAKLGTGVSGTQRCADRCSPRKHRQESRGLRLAITHSRAGHWRAASRHRRVSAVPVRQERSSAAGYERCCQRFQRS